MKMTLYYSDYCNNTGNCVYPYKKVVTDVITMAEVIAKDHVCAKYKNNYRHSNNFISADVIPMDIDNDHSENPDDWITAKKLDEIFTNIEYILVPSRNHNKIKEKKSARPRYHIYFPIEKCESVYAYTELKVALQKAYTFFDDNALDSARLLFASKTDEIVVHEGWMNIDEDIDTTNIRSDYKEIENPSSGSILEGSRNNTLSHFAGKVLKRLGETPKAREAFDLQAKKCEPPLDDTELETIWHSALRFFREKISKQEGYIAPDEYEDDFLDTLKPEDYSDVGQAVVMAREYENKLRYSPSTGYLVFNDSYWEESDPLAQAVAQELTTRQLEEAESDISKAVNEMQSNGAFALLVEMGAKKAAAAFNEEQKKAYNLYEDAISYRKYAIARRDSKRIASGLKEVRPMVSVQQSILDKDEFLLNTPSGTYDLRQGIGFVKKHDALDYITKQTAVDVGLDGQEIWEKALDTFFCKDKALIDYVQRIVGLSAVGKVYVEALIIAYGEGRNGKSTFWNVVSRVLGSYSGNISADVLTVGCKRNVKPELAEAKGKRLLIAAELEEGMRLNTSNVKQLCSTDEIYAEKKYKAPFSYIPSHTLVLYTNHLPRVGAIDKGTWRRLIVIPFEAKIEGNNDIKNYADYLFENAGGAILSWIINGAKKVIEDNYKITPPEKVKEAIQKYKENNDWMAQFLTECCEIDKSYIEKSGELYTSYRSYCMQLGEFARSTTDFYTALESCGFERYRTNRGRFVKGLKLKSDFME